MYYKKVEGERIYLSPMNPEDIDKYMRWINEAEVSLGLGIYQKIYSKEIEKKALENLANSESSYNFAIVDSKTNQAIGNCGLFDVDLVHKKAELGIFIGEEKKRGQGFGKEAMALLLQYGFDVLNLHNILLHYFSYNLRGENAYKSLGFKEVGRRRESAFFKGNYYDEVIMDILEREFRETTFYKNEMWSIEAYEF